MPTVYRNFRDKTINGNGTLLVGRDITEISNVFIG
jgi:hypothetical protein